MKKIRLPRKRKKKFKKWLKDNNRESEYTSIIKEFEEYYLDIYLFTNVKIFIDTDSGRLRF